MKKKKKKKKGVCFFAINGRWKFLKNSFIKQNDQEKIERGKEKIEKRYWNEKINRKLC